MSSELIKAAFDFRALLTDTLPYEVPVIFSNEKLFRAMGREFEDADLRKAVVAINQTTREFTIPYTYSIRKNRSNVTTLGIVHPSTQQRIASFYKKHQRSILASCSVSEFSLRRPKSVAQKFAEVLRPSDQSVLKSGVVDQEANEEEADIAHIVSYFKYDRYNLLGRFIDSSEFLELEKQFVRLKMLDISKCFFHIYTHSVTWAVKDKRFAKGNTTTYSFEAEFDELMQKANYNETNGIVIGPEASRIFAEIILQAVDREVQRELAGRDQICGRDYSVRRYVDDYYVFANSDEVIEQVEQVLERELEKYKLFLNASKKQVVGRPFVSNLSQARSELRELVSSIWEILDDKDALVLGALSAKRRWLRQVVAKIRHIVAKYDVETGNVSGWLLSAIRNLIAKVTAACSSEMSEDDAKEVVWFLSSILRVCFYVCALDLRVRSTYSLCQIILLVHRLKGKVDDVLHSELEHYVQSELVELIRASSAKLDWSRPLDPIELYNLLICGAHFLGADFIQMSPVSEAIRQIADASHLTYFGYVTAKFCWLVDPSKTGDVAKLNDRAKSCLLSSGRVGVRREAEAYLMMCDYLSSTDISLPNRREVFMACIGGQISSKTLGSLEHLIGFADFTGLKVQHLLRRKELRPVY